MNKKNLKLGDIIDSDSGLFEMYPELKDFKVTRGKGKATNAAIYTGLGKIEINFSKFKPYMSIPSNREKIDGILHRVINHEIQHAIQDSEGRRKDGGKVQCNVIYRKGIGRRSAPKRKDLGEQEGIQCTRF